MKDTDELAGNPDRIPGIYNYCDRWCERCSFSARCLVYAIEQTDSDDDPASRDISNAAFWQKLAAIFQETHEMIVAWAEKNGVDLSADVLAEAQAQKDREQGQARDHPLTLAADEYGYDVSQWFRNDAQKIPEFSDAAAESDETLDEQDVNDYVGVIFWYQYFIAAKIIRGLESRIDEGEDGQEDESRDSNGSIKVALIAIDRSLGAWRLFGELRGDSDHSIQNFMVALEKLRVLTETEFPMARDFIRPGFDENLDKLH